MGEKRASSRLEISSQSAGTPLQHLEILPPRLETVPHLAEMVPQVLEMAPHGAEMVPQVLEMIPHGVEMMIQYCAVIYVVDLVCFDGVICYIYK